MSRRDVVRPFVAADAVSEVSLHRYAVEASDLRLPPGSAPSILTTDLGNGRPLGLRAVQPDGTLVYEQEFGCISLSVFPD